MSSYGTVPPSRCPPPPPPRARLRLTDRRGAPAGRTLSDEHRAFGMAVNSIMYRLLGAIPGPIVLGVSWRPQPAAAAAAAAAAALHR